MPQIGGEIEQMNTLVTAFRAKAGEVTQLSNDVDRQLGATWWVGPAADRFRNSWTTEYKPALQRLNQALTDAAAEVDRRKQALVQSGG